MNDDSTEQRRRGLVPRVAVLACLTLAVAGLGLAWRPGSPGEPVEPPFSEQARSAALVDSLRLRAAGEHLDQPPAGDGNAMVARTVSLLTNQSRALLVPGQDNPADVSPSGADARAAASATRPPSAAGSAPASADPAIGPAPASAAELATELAASASRRLADAARADGGMARLLAAVGTAQLLQASSLAAAVGAPAPPVSVPAAPRLSGPCPGTSAPPSSSADSSASADTAAASLPGALAATVEAEREAVYGYQVALTRLTGTTAGPAAELLADHQALASGAEALGVMHCAPVPLREAGYTLTSAFLAAPGAGLGALEASALPVYGDLVALSDGPTREWAISGLVGAARRSALWGADTGVLPGMTADPGQFPDLPSPAATPSP
ncbi:DUF4439 domain-containing protein [Arthrobacter sp. MP_M7]|uniref:DUF4439 domain-containing protein n=1 Tax=Arthrobacter sp. MP_M7 TaxID=3071716 RepID=UPI002E13AE46